MIDENKTLKEILPHIEKERNSEADFLRESIKVGNYVRQCLGIVASLETCHINSDNKEFIGICLGHIVRLYKLYDTFLLLMCEDKPESASLFIRPIVESVLKLIYLLECSDRDNIIDLFKKSSLVYEKRLYDEIQKKLGSKDPDKLDKEILESIQNSFEKSGIDMSDIDWKKDKDWLKNTDLFQIAKNSSLLEMYEFLYRLGCHSIHGSWHELDTYHLNDLNDHYEPCLDYAGPRPDTIAVISVVVLKAAYKYLQIFTKGTSELMSNIEILHDWYTEIFKKYDQFRIS